MPQWDSLAVGVIQVSLVVKANWDSLVALVLDL